MKKINSLMLVVALAFGISTTSCNKNDAPSPENGEKQVQVKVDLGTNNRAEELTGFIAANTSLEAIQLDIYITNGQKVLRSVRINKTTNPSEWEALTATQGQGLKFLQISSKASDIIVIANASSSLVEKDHLVSEIKENITLSMDAKQVLGGRANLTPTSAEPAAGVLAPGENPSAQIADGTPVSTAKVIVSPIISRFQIVGVKFGKKVWNNQTLAYNEASEDELADDANYEVVPDTDAKLVGILMNRFHNTSVLSAGVAGSSSDLLYALTYAGSLGITGDNTTGYTTNSWKINNTDVTAQAAYVKNTYVDGITSNMFLETQKIAAFNFFAKGLTTDQNTPKLHFVISKKTKDGSYKLLFANIIRYKKIAAPTTTGDVEFTNGKLYNLNLTNETIHGINGTGVIITENEKPDEDDNLNPDITDVDINIVATVQVAQWASENVMPVFE